jgi:hypothetical protein
MRMLFGYFSLSSPTFDGAWSGADHKIGNKDTCSTEIGLLILITSHSTINITREDLCIKVRDQQLCKSF